MLTLSGFLLMMIIIKNLNIDEIHFKIKISNHFFRLLFHLSNIYLKFMIILFFFFIHIVVNLCVFKKKETMKMQATNQLTKKTTNLISYSNQFFCRFQKVKKKENVNKVVDIMRLLV